METVFPRTQATSPVLSWSISGDPLPLEPVLPDGTKSSIDINNHRYQKTKKDR